MHQFLTRQSIWLKEWCAYSHNRDKITAYLWVAGIAVVLTVIGILAKYPIPKVLTFHLPIGLFFGEALMVLCWPLISFKNNWKKILKGIKKRLKKDLPSAEVQQEFFSDYFNSDGEWVLVEKEKASLSRVTVGEKYWSLITHTGMVNIIDYRQLEHIDTFKETITVRVNNVRTTTTHYVAEFFSRDENPKKKLMGRYGFESRSNLDAFINLVQTRNNNQVVVTDVGTKRI